MKKTIINIVLVMLTFFIYFLQSNFFSWFNIAGIMPNLFIILVLFIGLFGTRTMGTIYGLIIGMILDFIIGTKVGIYSACLGALGFLAGTFDKNFSKDSRITIILMVLGSTIAFEIVRGIINYLIFTTNIEIISFIKIVVVEILYNIIITIIIYPLIQKFGYYIENEYKGNTIMTRYF